jgi:hypothetical protein
MDSEMTLRRSFRWATEGTGAYTIQVWYREGLFLTSRTWRSPGGQGR